MAFLAWACSATLLLALSAGCAEAPRGAALPEPQPAPEAPPIPAGPRPKPADPPRPGLPSSLILQDCTGWAVTTGPLPSPLASPFVPPGWEARNALVPVASVSVHGYECDRLSLAHFERGPVRLVVEFHDFADYPDSCSRELPNVYDRGVLSTVWVDDVEIARYLADTLGMPAHVARVSASAQPAGSATLHTWEWDAGGESSKVAVPEDPTTGPEPPAGPTRLFWAWGDGIGQLQLEQQATGPYPGNRAAHGTFQPPMLMAEISGGAFAGVGDWHPSLQEQGAFAFYKDLLCETPA